MASIAAGSTFTRSMGRLSHSQGPYDELLAELEWELQTPERGRVCSYRRLVDRAEADPNPERGARARASGAARMARAAYAEGDAPEGDGYLAELEALAASRGQDAHLRLVLAETLATALELLAPRLGSSEVRSYARSLHGLVAAHPEDPELAPFAAVAAEAQAEALLEEVDLVGLKRSLEELRALAGERAGAERETGLARAEVWVGTRLVLALCLTGRHSQAKNILGELAAVGSVLSDDPRTAEALSLADAAVRGTSG